MGEIETRGPRAAEFLRHLLTNDIAKVGRAGAQYSLLCREDGGVLDDLFTYRLAPNGEEQRFLTVVNASNADSDFDWFRRQADGWEGVEVTDRSADYAMLALQGPRGAGRPLRRCSRRAPPRSASATPRRWWRACRRSCAAPATPGEDGVELLLEPEGATARLGRAARARSPTGRARRARHPAPRGLLPAVRK